VQTITVESPVVILATADDNDAFAAALEDGTLALWSSPKAPPQRWRLRGPMDALWLASDGRMAYALDSGDLVAISDESAAPISLLKDAYTHQRQLAAALHPSGRGAAFALSDRDTVIVHEAGSAALTEHPMALGVAPAIAYSPTGSWLAVTRPGAAIEIMDLASELNTTIALPRPAIALAAIDEETVAVSERREHSEPWASPGLLDVGDPWDLVRADDGRRDVHRRTTRSSSERSLCATALRRSGAASLGTSAPPLPRPRC
jgi:hypothetical protein